MFSRAEAADQLRLGLGARLEVGSVAWAATEALNECALELAGLTTILGGICNYVFLSSCFYICQLCPLLAHFLSISLSLSAVVVACCCCCSHFAPNCCKCKIAAIFYDSSARLDVDVDDANSASASALPAPHSAPVLDCERV